MYGIKDVSKKNCADVLVKAQIVNDKLSEKNSKNVNMLMTHTINEHIRPFIVQANAFETYAGMKKYLLQYSERRVDILEAIKTITSTDMTAYVHDMRAIQAKIIFIDFNRAHPETKAPAYIPRILDNLSEEQKNMSSGADVTILEARLAAEEALYTMYASKNKASSAASAMALIDKILSSTSDNEAEKEATLIDLSQSFSAM